MKFRATFRRGDRTVPVTGSVGQRARDWHGAFAFATDDVPAIDPGPAELLTDDGKTWEILVSSCRVSSSGRGQCDFRVLKGLP